MADETPIPEPETPTAEPVAAAPEPVAPAPQYATKDDFSRLESALASLASLLPRQQPQTQEISNDDLYTAATQGNRAATEEFYRRLAREEAGRIAQSERQNQLYLNQLSAVTQKYPELLQQGHALNDRFKAFYNALKPIGGYTNESHLQLDAALRAVADSRDVIGSKPTGPSRAPVSSQMTPSHKQPATPVDPVERIIPQEHLLAKKMGIKDPAKAKKKFWERNAEGRSTVAPNVAAALQMDGQA